MQHPEPHDITALAYGLIEGPERDTLLTHLSECDACRSVYDGYREEQAAVRDSIVRDARSGAAEARALESTLDMLAGLEGAQKPRARLLTMPRWLLVAEVAAMLAVAVGLFFILKPGDETGPEVVPIAEELRAPAEVSDGVVYVSDRQGDWKPAEALPEDEWVMAGSEGPLVLKLANGSLARLEPSSVFRLGRDGESKQLLLQFLRGNGVVDTTAMTDNMFVRSGEAGFYAMPDARFTITSELQDTRLRSWTQPDRVNAAVSTGDVVLWPQAARYNKLPLQGGDKVEWTPEEFKVYTQGGKAVPLTFAWRARSGNAETAPYELQANEYYTIMLELEPRMKALRERIENMPLRNHPRDLDLRRFLDMDLHTGDDGPLQVFEEGDVRIVVKKLTGIDDTARIELEENGVKRVIVVRTDGQKISVEVSGGAVRTSFESQSIEELKARVPADVLEILDQVRFSKNADGMHRIEGAHVDGEGVTVIVTSNSRK